MIRRQRLWPTVSDTPPKHPTPATDEDSDEAQSEVLSARAAAKLNSDDAVASAEDTSPKPDAQGQESESSFAGFASQETVEDDDLPGFGDQAQGGDQKLAG